MHFPARPLFAALALAAMLTPLASAAQEKPLTKPEIEALVKQVIKDNPDLIFQTLYDFQEKTRLDSLSEAAVNLSKLQDKINYDPRSPSIGNPKGDVTVVEFFDYHCGYCKRFAPEVTKLIQDDKNVRIVFKEFPILSEDSALAAKAALAVYSIDKAKYFAYHTALMNEKGGFNEEVLADLAKRTDIDETAFKKAFADPELDKDLERNRDLAHSLNISGTPAIIIGTELMPGAIPYDKLVDKIEEARNSVKQKKNADRRRKKD